MIFVTVGMHSQGFERLIKKMDEIAGNIDEEVIMQIGSTKYTPKNAKYFDYINDFEQIKELNRTARIVVCHGGAGTILTALDQGIPIIAVPRLKKYQEHINNHQMEIVNVLAATGKITAVYNIEELERIIRNNLPPNQEKAKKDERLVKKLKEYINNLPG